MPSYSIMIVDDHPIMRYGLRLLLEQDKEFIVVSESGNAQEAITTAKQLNPDLIMMDLHLQGRSGIDIIRSLRRCGLTSYVLVLSISDSRNDVYAALDAGANGYLLKECELDMLLLSLRKAVVGRPVYSEKVWQYIQLRQNYSDPLSALTKRELDVLQEVAVGMKNKQIAENLFISEETVKVHIRNILKKLQVTSRLAASLILISISTKRIYPDIKSG
ncbi:response regulator [Proteus mirabilis]|uniref:response regulator n=5 Tax=Proteus mirabilis TaxID=584 RepID=UPI003D04F1B3